GRTEAVLLDAPIARYYGEIEPGLEELPESFGEVRYAIALRPADEALRAALDEQLAALGRSGALRRIYERWGLWNAETANLLGDARASGTSVAEAFEAWRSSVGRMPPLWERVRERYPQTFPLFARGAVLTLALSFAAFALAVPLGMLLAIART